eukprot:CAMPEP_0179137944 /NCGR_PEP_ID=MMETSP0796-20121207/65843_1 /TAXON_ID=73915 /ORGANISM="Pyrodinium bahamense, Strain pbaha01" /LENGTH=170 /DNA_ID=CAMNT_0020837175 /DNA_START=136 /DNA_END=644 /DNA_ORIENTATION=-
MRFNCCCAFFFPPLPVHGVPSKSVLLIPPSCPCKRPPQKGTNISPCTCDSRRGPWIPELHMVLWQPPPQPFQQPPSSQPSLSVPFSPQHSENNARMSDRGSRKKASADVRRVAFETLAADHALELGGGTDRHREEGTAIRAKAERRVLHDSAVTVSAQGTSELMRAGTLT